MLTTQDLIKQLEDFLDNSILNSITEAGRGSKLRSDIRPHELTQAEILIDSYKQMLWQIKYRVSILENQLNLKYQLNLMLKSVIAQTFTINPNFALTAATSGAPPLFFNPNIQQAPFTASTQTVAAETANRKRKSNTIHTESEQRKKHNTMTPT